MQVDPFGQPIFSESDLIDHLMAGRDIHTGTWLTDDTVSDVNSIRWLVDDLPQIERYHPPNGTLREYDRSNQQQWLMPQEYRDLDIVQHVLNLCANDAELQRAGEELLLYAEKDLLDLLRYIVYLVDTMRVNNVVWGVGRGSSVASFVLFLLGVHRINSLFYDLDIREFLR